MLRGKLLVAQGGGPTRDVRFGAPTLIDGMTRIGAKLPARSFECLFPKFARLAAGELPASTRAIAAPLPDHI